MTDNLYCIIRTNEAGEQYIERITTGLPERIILPDGFTRTSLEQLTEAELQAAGVLPLVVTNADYNPDTEIRELQADIIKSGYVERSYLITPISQEVIEQRAQQSLAAAWGTIRATRNQLLAETDRKWDAPNKEDYALYRQSLRDIPATYPTPDAVIWPDKPE